MTPNAQIKAIAELDGREYHKSTEAEIATGSYYQYEPNYLHSRDAIIPVIEKQSHRIKTNFVMFLWCSLCIKHDDAWQTDDIIAIYFATPSQLSEALLRATGNWVNDSQVSEPAKVSQPNSLA